MQNPQPRRTERLTVFSFVIVTVLALSPFAHADRVTHSQKKKLVANVVSACSGNGACCTSVSVALEFPNEKWEGECHIYPADPMDTISRLKDHMGQQIEVEAQYMWYNGNNPKDHPDKIGHFKKIAGNKTPNQNAGQGYAIAGAMIAAAGGNAVPVQQPTATYPSSDTTSSTPASQYPNNTSGSQNHLVAGLRQCTSTQWDANVAALYVVNRCNVPVYVGFTSVSGQFWGGANMGPNSRSLVSTFGMGYDPKRDSTVWLYTCPQYDTPMIPNGTPNGSSDMPHNYNGECSCYQP